ncbi:SDR family NAD(P)-dependent oxidoreductase [Marinicella gelatinilytica]|uniref:SDR family NAD(P)-dependent oxidoreductase n=1 Tax=Marinicella gelatinilytica TaxID=2996017 RepID=UPI002260A5A4|nr:SDR family NAD(P)-dependent oxidoreductase [Marinicella gelatinilytica]MCX7545297.1 SDR family NAD(P)-dependent oxidoreductase [Marinicella gelatinilytica]
MDKYHQLKGKTYFLTGACGGLGSAIALRLSQQQANLVISDKSPKTLDKLCDELLKRGLPEPVIYPMDLIGATPNDYIQLAKQLEKHFGRLDGLIHTAVEFGSLSPFILYEASRWLKEMQVNVNSPIFLTQALLPLLLKAKGHIIFTSDDLNLTAKAYWGQYGVAKAAIEQFAKILSQECENQGVKVSTLTPPPMPTTLRAKVWPSEDASKLNKPTEVALQYLDELLTS